MPGRDVLQWVEVSKHALKHNVHVFAAVAGKQSRVIPIVKGNAYGHGMVEVASALAHETIWGFGVASYTEALVLRRNGITNPILVLSYYAPEQIVQRGLAGITFVVYDTDNIRALNRVGKRLNRIIPVHLKIDTGTSRIGIRPTELSAAISAQHRATSLRLTGAFTHFAEAEITDTHTEKQQAIFDSAFLRLQKAFPQPLEHHSACSAAIVLHPGTRSSLVRLGIGTYGVSPSQATARVLRKAGKSLTPALTWKTRVVQVKRVPAGTAIGYHRTYKARTAQTIAILPVGYADGYPRSLSNVGIVLVNDKSCPVRGRICMNLMMVDVTGVRNVTPGTVVTLLEGLGNISADQVAQRAGTISYELITRISPVIPRILTA